VQAVSEFLKDFLDVIELAADINKTPRTVDRWCTQPDGLPHTWLGNKRFIHIPTAREWLLSRMRQPNPRRIGRPRKPAAEAAEAAQPT
jgi:hypothetical protein